MLWHRDTHITHKAEYHAPSRVFRSSSVLMSITHIPLILVPIQFHTFSIKLKSEPLLDKGIESTAAAWTEFGRLSRRESWQTLLVEAGESSWLLWNTGLPPDPHKCITWRYIQRVGYHCWQIVFSFITHLAMLCTQGCFHTGRQAP